MWDKKGGLLQTVRERSKGMLIPPARAYVRHFPIHTGKSRFFERVVNPYLQWHGHEFVARTVFGAKVAGRSSEILQQYLYYFGVWEPNLTDWISRQLEPGDTFVDVGANIGYFSMLASRLVGDSGRVVAVEPSPHASLELQANLGRNWSRNVRVVHAAASDCRGTIRMYEGPDTHTGLCSFLEASLLEEDFEVETMPLTDVLQPAELRTLRLIKIDVEGAEALVVDGLAPLLDSAPSNLDVIVEIGPKRLAAQGRRPEDILGTFADAGFHPYALQNDYSWRAYVPPRQVQRPQRVDAPLRQETDIIFSRRDAATL